MVKKLRDILIVLNLASVLVIAILFLILIIFKS